MNSASPALPFPATGTTGPRLRVPSPLSGWSVVLRVLLVCAFVFVVFAGLLAWSFLPRGEVRQLRRAALSQLSGDWQRLVEVRVGGTLCSAGQVAAAFAGAPPEALAVLDCVDSAEVSVHQRTPGTGSRTDDEAANLIAITTEAMSARGWEPLVRVHSDHDTVAVFLAPTNVHETVRLCVFVHDGNQLVVAACEGRLAPLLRILNTRSFQDWERRFKRF